jgi:hypothetical protein
MIQNEKINEKLMQAAAEFMRDCQGNFPKAPVSDLVATLRNASQEDSDGVIVTISRQACEEAADEIERLTKLYESAVRGRADMRQALRDERQNAAYSATFAAQRERGILDDEM